MYTLQPLQSSLIIVHSCASLQRVNTTIEQPPTRQRASLLLPKQSRHLFRFMLYPT